MTERTDDVVADLALGAHDPLTGLHNRRHLEARLMQMASAARRHGFPLSVLLLGIDHFKAVNDTFGHAGGDAVLRAFAVRLPPNLRAEDIVGRWAGEEFLVRTVDWAPRSLRRSARSVEVVSGRLSNDLGRTPTAAETAAALGMCPQQLAELQEQLTRSVVLTLDMAVTDSDGQDVVALGDTLSGDSESTEEELETRERHAYLRDAVELLPDRHRIVIEGYFFGGRTSEDLAQELGVTVSRISQLRSDACEILKDGIAFQFVDPAETKPAEVHPKTAARKLNYANAIAARSTWRDRLQPQVRVARPMALAI